MRRIQILFAVVVLIVVGWSGAWVFGAGYVKTQVKSLAKADGVTTPRLACKDLSVDGFPFRFDAVCLNARVTLGDLTVSIPEVVGSVLVYQPTHALVLMKSPAHISDAFSGSERELSWGQAEASLRLSGWKLARLSIQFKKPVFSDTLVGQTRLAGADLFEFHLLDAPDLADKAKKLAGLAYFERLDGLDVPGIGVRKARLTVEGTITGMPADVRRWGDPDIARAFQAAGGAVTLKSLDYSDSGSSVKASGQATLGPKGRVNGAATVTSKGVVEKFGNDLPEPLRSAIVGTQQSDGSYEQNIQIRNGVVMAGLVPVAVLPPLF